MNETGKTLTSLDYVEIPDSIFRAYDIRGVYGEELSAAVIRRIALAIGSEARALGIDALLCGRDARLSSPELSVALIAGLRESGINVIDLGIIPTPQLYFASHVSQWHSGVMLTASHNPAEYNGIKIVFRQASLTAESIQQIKRRAQQQLFTSGRGSLQALDIAPQFIAQVCGHVKIQGRPRVVIDCGNAVTSLLAPQLFKALGCELELLFCELDGRFPNHAPDPTQPENLRQLVETVLATQADIGFAFDGDGDRLGIVANDGQIIDADRLLAVLIKHIVPAHPGEPVIFDVKCSSRLAGLIRKYGGVPVMHRSGHSFMKQKMQETGAPLGGEYSAHIFIKDRWYGYDDGLYTAARVLEILTASKQTSSELFASLGSRACTPELKVAVAETDKFALMERILSLADFPGARIILLDGIRVEFDDGWGLVRVSNTSPALLLRFEADNAQALESIKARFASLLLQADQSLPINFLNN